MNKDSNNRIEDGDECDRYDIEDCPFTLAELGIEENSIEYGTPDGVIEYLKQKGEF